MKHGTKHQLKYKELACELKKKFKRATLYTVLNLEWDEHNEEYFPDGVVYDVFISIDEALEYCSQREKTFGIYKTDGFILDKDVNTQLLYEVYPLTELDFADEQSMDFEIYKHDNETIIAGATILPKNYKSTVKIINK